ncbi:hypothetical protein WOLCODRAFT_160317 [Wolfiporia cocos MD-104 SS10]|uniref:Uncharacterized protein n=1 Tax=Wolfiporia cocos (strain MD-104) TaxID=742152 RepID=A0A2H3J7Y2_WOLCO|nr:hypothetical protein WOLCODRAFT_160317 [Wolfiporia cocos MD-104 SS10]
MNPGSIFSTLVPGPSPASAAAQADASQANLANLYNMFGLMSQAIPATPTPLASGMSQSNTFVSPAPAMSYHAANTPINAQGGNEFSEILNKMSSMMTQLNRLASQQANEFSITLQNVLTEAIRLSSPVGTSVDDEQRLVQALYESEMKGQTYCQALDSLHAINNHSSMMWKNYYLEHSKRINKLVAGRRNTTPVSLNGRPVRSEETTSRPEQSGGHTPPVGPMQVSRTRPELPRSRNQRDQHGEASASSTARYRGEQSTSAQPQRRNIVPLPRSTTSQQIVTTQRLHVPRHSPPSVSEDDSSENSKEARPAPIRKQLAVKAPRMPLSTSDRVRRSSRNEIRIPTPPTRSPTPPTRVEPAARGTKFTDEDKVFFVKFLQWELGRNPRLTRSELNRMLAEKVPHHSAHSWDNQWARCNGIAERLYSEAIKLAEEQSEGDEGTVERLGVDDTTPGSDELSDWDVSDDESDPPTEEDERNMGQSRQPYTDADVRILAKYIAATPDWYDLPRGKKFGPYAEKYPQRSVEAYAQWYTDVKKREVDRMVRKIKRRNRDRKGKFVEIKEESGTPDPSLGPSSSKRPADDEDATTTRPEKRPREDNVQDEHTGLLSWP